MKQILLYISLFFVNTAIYAQFNLVRSITTNTSMQYFETNSHGIMFYELPDTINNVLKIYNEDFSSYKNIIINRPIGYTLNVSLLSEQLFNSNNLIEFICVFSKPSYTDTNGSKSKIIVYDENNATVKDFGTYNYTMAFPSYFKSGNVFNLMILGVYYTSFVTFQSKWVTQIYSLTGNLPNSIPQISDSITQNAYPNPTKIFVTLPYVLSQGQTSTLSIYKLNGELVEKKKIGCDANKIVLNVNSYNSGVYIYEYNGVSKKFVVN